MSREQDLPKNYRLKGMVLCEALARICRLMVDSYGTDIEQSMIYLVVIAASGSHMRRDPELVQLQVRDQPLPQEQLRGVSRRAIAESIGLPRERVRRKINDLVERGVLLEENGMVMPRAPILGRPENMGLLMTLLKQFDRAHLELERADAA